MGRITAIAATTLIVVITGAGPAFASGPGSGSGPAIAGSIAARRAAASFAAPAPAAKARAATGVTVTISSNCASFCYVPAQASIGAGDTVTWVNRSGADHTVTRCTPAVCNGASGGTGTDKTFTAATIGAATGATFSHTFTAPGTYVYYCAIHGYALMHGTITVTAVVTPTTTPPTAAPAITPPPAPTTPPSPQLANTGGSTDGAIALALALITLGLAATSVQLGRRHS